MKTPDVIATTAELRARTAVWRREGARIGLVPTMGALHEGHLSLIDAAGKRSKRVVVSIFVNPKQFDPTEDFQRYPRNLEQDRARIAEHGVAGTIFFPHHEEIYPEGF